MLSIKQLVAEVEALEERAGVNISRHNYEDQIRESWIREVLHELDPQGLKLTSDDERALRGIDTKDEAKAILVKRYPDFNKRATDEIIQGLRWDSEAMVGVWGFDKIVELAKTSGSNLVSVWIGAVVKKGLILHSSAEGDRVSYNMREAVQGAGKFLNRIAGLGTFDCWATCSSARTLDELASAFGNVYGVQCKAFKNGKFKIQFSDPKVCVKVGTAIANYIENRQRINSSLEG